MTEQPNPESVLAPAGPRGYDVRSVTSKDGTSIGYRAMGAGPGVILVQGAMGTAQNYDELARFMADRFTVYLPDRRGRGMSPKDYDPRHDIARDVEDLSSLLVQTGARFVFGLSSGAMIVLEALKVLRTIDRAVVYEPPFYLTGISHKLIKRFNVQIERGRFASALVTVSKLVKLGPAWLPLVPGFLLRLGTMKLLRDDSRKSASPYARLQELIPAMRYDFNVVGGMDGKLATLKGIQVPVLLLGGDRSSAYLKAALKGVKEVIPNASLLEFKGLDHSGAWNRDRGGAPEVVAHAMCKFLGS